VPIKKKESLRRKKRERGNFLLEISGRRKTDELEAEPKQNWSYKNFSFGQPFNKRVSKIA